MRIKHSLRNEAFMMASAIDVTINQQHFLSGRESRQHVNSIKTQQYRLWKKSFTCQVMILGFTCWYTSQGYGQVLWSNAIADSNPSAFNPYTLGQTVASNITVSGIGRGSGISANAGSGRYNAASWASSFDANDYFYFTLTPNSGYRIDFTSWTGQWQRSGTGPTSYNLRSSLDGYASNLASGSITGSASPVSYNLNVSAASLNAIAAPITFRLYAFGGTNPAGTFSFNDFTISGTVTLIPTGNGDLSIPTAGPLNFNRVMLGSSVSPLPFTLQENNIAATTYTATDNSAKLSVAPTSGSIAQNGTVPMSVTLDTSSIGSAAGTVMVTNNNDTNDAPTIEVTGSVVQQRIVTAATSTARVMVGSSNTINTTLSTTGNDDSHTRVTVAGALFDAPTDVIITPVTFTAPLTPGASLTNIAALPVTGEGLASEGSYSDVAVQANLQTLENRDLTGSSTITPIRAIVGTPLTGSLNVTADNKSDLTGSRLILGSGSVTNGDLTIINTTANTFDSAFESHSVDYAVAGTLAVGTHNLAVNLNPLLTSGENGGASTLFAFDNFESDQALLSFTQTPAPGSFSSAGDGFQEYTRGSGSFPFNLVDDSVQAASGGSPFAGDVHAVIGRNKTDRWFGITDTDNTNNPGGNFSATWVFDIANRTDLSVSIDMAAMGNFDANDIFNFEYSIDGSSFLPLFSSFVAGGSQTYTFDDGDIVNLANPLGMLHNTGITTVLNRATPAGALASLNALVAGQGSQLTVRLTGRTNDESSDDAFAFDSVSVSGRGFGLLPGQVLDDTITMGVSAEIVNPSNASFIAGDGTAAGDTLLSTIGPVLVSQSGSVGISLHNVGNASDTALLDLLSISFLSGDDVFDFNLTSFANLLAGNFNNLTATLDATSLLVGPYTGTYQLIFQDEAGIIGAGATEVLTLTLQASVVNNVIPEPATALLIPLTSGLVLLRRRR